MRSAVATTIEGWISAGQQERDVMSRLPLAVGLVSVHAYSGAQANGQTTVESVRALIEATNRSLT